MALQNYQNVTEMTSNMIFIVAFGVGLKCLSKIHLNTQWGGVVMWWAPLVETPGSAISKIVANRKNLPKYITY